MREPESTLGAVWIWFGLLLFGAFGVGVSIYAAGGGHGSYLPAAVFFPFTMVLAAIQGKIGGLGVALAILQFPAYAAYLSHFAGRGLLRARLKLLAAAHTVAAAIAFGLSFLPGSFPLVP